MKIKFENVTHQSLCDYINNKPDLSNITRNSPEFGAEDRNGGHWRNYIFNLLPYLTGRSVFSRMNNANNIVWTEVFLGIREIIPSVGIRNILFNNIKGNLFNKDIEAPIFGIIKSRPEKR